MKSNPSNLRILTVNGGSSSIRFALFEPRKTGIHRILQGKIDRIGLPHSTMQVKELAGVAKNVSWTIAAKNHAAAVGELTAWLEKRIDRGTLAAVGHRIVHGGPKYYQAQVVTQKMIRELRRMEPFDPQHLPGEILLTEAFRKKHPGLPQVACFDTAFHHDLPAVAQIIPIPRRYRKAGVRRYGFHGLSYTFLMRELARQAGSKAARGRIVLAHLGNGASLAAVHRGKPIDTSMAFTPTAGIPMSTRSGDIDPGLIGFLAATEGMDVKEFSHMVNFQSGLLGVSGTESDMRDLLKSEKTDERAAEAVALFCYQAKKWVGAFAAALGGLDTLVFAGGIGENSPETRLRICTGLDFLGVNMDRKRNAANAPVISASGSKVCVRVIHTDEEQVIATTVCRVLGLKNGKETRP